MTHIPVGPNLLDPQTYVDLVNEAERADDARFRRAIEVAMHNARVHERSELAKRLDALAETFKTGTAKSVEWAFDLARSEMLAMADDIRSGERT